MACSFDAPALDFSQMGGSSGPARSPRTPTYAPNSPSFANVSPFDPFDLYSVSPVSPTHRTPLTKRKPRVPPPPPKLPGAWIWKCHICNSRWHLGATRRCLVDGHYYCAGQGQKNVKGKKKGLACSSEFDYVGWKRYGDWKLKAWRAMDDTKKLGRCETCVFPSECRYNRTGQTLPPGAVKGPKPENKQETYSSANRETLQTQDDKDDSSRYYSPDRATSNQFSLTKGFEDTDKSTSIPESAGPSQSKVTNFYKPGKDAHGGSGTQQIKRNAFSRTNSSQTLDSIMEEPVSPASEGSATQGLPDLVMPVLDDWALKDEEW